MTVAPSAASTIVRSTCEIDVVALAHEARVGLDADEHVHVAGTAAERARMALAGDADALTVVDPGRNLDVERSRLARRARRRGIPCTGARRSRRGRGSRGHAWARTNSPKRLRETWCRRPLPSQRGTGPRLRSRLDPVAAAHLAGGRHLERHLHLRSARGLDELDLDLCADVRAPLLRAAAHAAAEDVVAEERGEEVAQPADVEVGRREPAGPETGMPVAVVEGAPLGAREHLVGLGHLAEADLRLRFARDVGMQLAREAAERLLDRGVVGVTRDAEQLVVVAIGAHQSSA